MFKATWCEVGSDRRSNIKFDVDLCIEQHIGFKYHIYTVVYFLPVTALVIQRLLKGMSILIFFFI